MVDDKNINDSLFNNENEPDSLKNYFLKIFNEFCPFNSNIINFPMDLIGDIKNKISEYENIYF